MDVELLTLNQTNKDYPFFMIKFEEIYKTKKLLCSSLFWDTTPDHIDLDGNARFIIERVISRGTLDDWKTILAYYGNDKVKKEVVRIRSLDPKSLSYLCVFFNIDASKFRCCS